jgi:hypothetical protein
VGKIYSSVALSARQAAQSYQDALDRHVVRAAVDLTTLCMHAFNTRQRPFQVIATARVSVQQALARQSCIIASHSSMRAATAVRDCWEGSLLHSRRVAAGHACILSSQNCVLIRVNCARVCSSNTAAAVAVAVDASDGAHTHVDAGKVVRISPQGHTSDTGAVPSIASDDV